jgi:hypothetical protein
MLPTSNYSNTEQEYQRMTIYTHVHHIVPKHMGGTDDPENLIELTVEEHAEAHRKLYEEYGHWQDKIAWKALSGQIENQDIIRQVQSENMKNRVYTDEIKRNMSEGQKGKKFSEETIQRRREMYTGEGNNFYGKKHTEESKKKMRMAAKNRPPISEETKKKLSEANKGKQPRVSCPHCSKVGGVSAMKRHHFDNCKEK